MAIITARKNRMGGEVTRKCGERGDINLPFRGLRIPLWVNMITDRFSARCDEVIPLSILPTRDHQPRDIFPWCSMNYIERGVSFLS